MMDDVTALNERLRAYGIEALTVWEPLTAGQPTHIEVRDETTGLHHPVRKLPTLHLMADCVSVARAQERDGQVPARHVTLAELAALVEEPGRTLCGRCQRRLVAELTRQAAAVQRLRHPSLRQLLHELTAEYTNLDEPVYVEMYDSAGEYVRCVVTGISVRAGGQSLTLKPVEQPGAPVVDGDDQAVQ